MTAANSNEVRVALFCGGRGSASLIRELLRWPNIRLTLLVNAYDDGLSTGALRDFIPGMLGPSDFRKNLSYLLDLYSTQQYALQRLIEYRLPFNVGPADIAALKTYARKGETAGIGVPLDRLLADLDAAMGASIRNWLAAFFVYADTNPQGFDYTDCSLGNLIFAGAYLKSGGFNAAAKELARLFGSRAELVNVSRGECRSLVALKQDGSLLRNEAEIVGEQSAVPIRETYFMERSVTADEWSSIAGGSIEEKDQWLREREVRVELSAEAARAIADADVVLYGPGTQYSSLLPSYRIAADAIKRAPARIKLFVVNLHEDNDIRTLGATDLIDRALGYLDDPENANRVITHALYNRASACDSLSIELDHEKLDEKYLYSSIQILENEFQNPVDTKIHSGHRMVRTMLDLLANGGAIDAKPAIEIYVDLLDRSLALDGLLQEFLEIDWQAQFRHVRLRINGLGVPARRMPGHLAIEQTRYETMFSEVAVFLDWLHNGNSDYLVTLTGDGEYRLRDVLLGVTLLRDGSFGAVYGSRTQSRQQFLTSLHAAYGEGGALFALSWLGAFLLTVLFALRFRVIFSDPLTGFRVFQRNRLQGGFVRLALAKPPVTAASMTRLLVQAKVEIAEIPVGYRTFTGFTRPSWRLSRGLRNLLGLVR